MKVYRFLLFCFCGCILICSCQFNSTHKALKLAERQIHDKPDSVLQLLKTIKANDIHFFQDNADYHLLLAMALDKCDSVVTDENLLTPAISFYEKRNNHHRLATALYYLGRIQQNNEDYVSSMVSFTRAEQLLASFDDKRIAYLLYMAMADNCARTYNPMDELAYTKKAMNVVTTSDLESYVPGAMYRYAATLANNREYTLAISILDSLYSLPSLQDTYLKNLCLVRSTFYKTNHHLDSPEKLLQIYYNIQQEGLPIEMDDYCAYAYLLGRCGEKEKSDNLFKRIKQVFPEKGQIALSWESDLAAENGQYEMAYKLLDSTLSYQNIIVRKTLEQSLSRTQKDYFQSKLSESEQERKIDRLIIIIIFLCNIIIIVLLIALAFSFWRRKQIIEQENRIKIDALRTSLKMVESEKESSLDSLRKQYLSRMFRPLGRIYGDYQFRVQHGDNPEQCQKQLINALNQINIEDGNGWFESTLNEETDNLPKRFKEDYPSLKAEDYRLFCFYLAGFDATTISIIMHLASQNAVYIRKSRLRNMIKKSNSSNCPIYLSVLS